MNGELSLLNWFLPTGLRTSLPSSAHYSHSPALDPHCSVYYCLDRSPAVHALRIHKGTWCHARCPRRCHETRIRRALWARRGMEARDGHCGLSLPKVCGFFLRFFSLFNTTLEPYTTSCTTSLPLASFHWLVTDPRKPRRVGPPMDDILVKEKVYKNKQVTIISLKYTYPSLFTNLSELGHNTMPSKRYLRPHTAIFSSSRCLGFPHHPPYARLI